MKYTGDEGKVVSKEIADEITGRYTANRESIESEGKEYIESYFFGVETLKELITGIPVKSILGVKIKHGIKDVDGKESPTIVLELVSKDKTSQTRFADDPPACPIFCS